MNTNQPRGWGWWGEGDEFVAGSLCTCTCASVFSVRVVMKERLSDRPSAL